MTDKFVEANRFFTEEALRLMDDSASDIIAFEVSNMMKDMADICTGAVDWGSLRIVMDREVYNPSLLRLKSTLAFQENPLATNVADMQAIVEQLAQEPGID